MRSRLDQMWSLGAWNWMFAAVALFVLESMVPGVHFLWFGLAALIVGGLGLATGLGWPWQLVAFAVLSVVSVFWVRHYFSRDNEVSAEPHLNDTGRQFVGRVVVVEDAITNGRGRVRVGDSIWTAEGKDAPKGSRVRIVGSDGTVLRVENAAA